jgi:hypothetical protein
MAPPLTEEPDGQDRDEKGRFRKGWRGGPGGAKQAYVRARARLYEALMREFSVDDVRALLRALYNQAMDGNSRAAGLLIAYLCGKPPDAMSARELYPAARVTRESVMSIEALSARLQRLLEDFEAGTVNAEDTRATRDILGSLIQARQIADVERKLDELRLIMERSDNGQPS